MYLRHELEEHYIWNDADSVCRFDLYSPRNFVNLFLFSDPEMIHINSSPEAPPPRIRILDARSREVETVRIGDRLTFRIEIPEDSKCWSNNNGPKWSKH